MERLEGWIRRQRSLRKQCLALCLGETLILHSSLPCNSAFTSKKHVRLVLRLGKRDYMASVSDPIAALSHLLLLLYCKLSKGTHRAQGQLLPWVPPC